MASSNEAFDVEVARQKVIATTAGRQTIVERNGRRLLLIIAQDGTGTDVAGVGGMAVNDTQFHPMLAGERIAIRRDEGAGAAWACVAITGTPNLRITEIIETPPGA